MLSLTVLKAHVAGLVECVRATPITQYDAFTKSLRGKPISAVEKADIALSSGPLGIKLLAAAQNFSEMVGKVGDNLRGR